VPLLGGSLATLGCGGAALGRRIFAAAATGAFTAWVATLVLIILGVASGVAAAGVLPIAVWRTFLLTILATLGAVFTELSLPEPPAG